MIFTLLYSLFLFLLTIFSWSFVGNNFPFMSRNVLFDFIHKTWWLTGGFYCFFVIVFFIFYLIILHKAQKGLIKSTYIWKIIVLTVFILLFAFPSFSYDIFNYIATAKVSFLYKENPYIVMPIEIPNEPLLSFMHAANKTALYGPIWILLTFIPHQLGFNNLLLTIYTFKVLIAFFYLALCFLIWKLSRKNVEMLIFFALNPLILIESLISSHNDVVMMFLVLVSFYLLKRKKMGFSAILYVSSIFTKFATVFLLPVYLYVFYLTVKKKNIPWGHVWFWATISMFVIFFLAPLREEIYSWYLIWPLTFVSFISNHRFIRLLVLVLSFGLLFRFAPFLFTLNWGGTTPFIKRLVTFSPPILLGLYYAIRKKI